MDEQGKENLFACSYDVACCSDVINLWSTSATCRTGSSTCRKKEACGKGTGISDTEHRNKLKKEQ